MQLILFIWFIRVIINQINRKSCHLANILAVHIVTWANILAVRIVSWPTYWQFVLSFDQHTGRSYCHLANILAVRIVTWTTYWQFILSLGQHTGSSYCHLGQHTGNSYCHLANILAVRIVSWPTYWQFVLSFDQHTGRSYCYLANNEVAEIVTLCKLTVCCTIHPALVSHPFVLRVLFLYFFNVPR